MSLLSKAQSYKSMRSPRDKYDPELIELAENYIYGNVDYAQVVHAIGIKSFSSKFLSALRHKYSYVQQDLKKRK